MKVGILTYHHRTNYGGLLQALALQRYVTSQGHEAQIIDYRPFRIWSRDIVHEATSLASGNWIPTKKAIAFRESRATMDCGPTSCTRHCLKHHYRDRYDVVVVGSDEVWNFQTKRGFDTSYVLDFTDARTRLVSYAASAGGDTWASEIRQPISDHLSRFHMISARDEHTLNLVRSCSALSAELVADPTFLVEDWPRDYRPASEPYLFVAGDLPHDAQAAVARYADRNCLKIVTGGYSYPNIKADAMILRPMEWVSAIANAEVVATSLFHAVAFAGTFNRPFSIHLSPRKKEKITELCNLFDTTISDSALLQTAETISTLGVAKLDALRSSSKEYLRRALG